MSGLGSSPPIPSTPPARISIQTSNEDVKLWVYHCVRKNQAYLTDNEAWALARNVKGVGHVVLRYDKEAWEKEIPGWGHTIYIALQDTQEYVVSDTRLY